MKSCMTTIPDQYFEEICALVRERKLTGRKKVESLSVISDEARKYWAQHAREYKETCDVTIGKRKTVGIRTADGRVLLKKSDSEELCFLAVSRTRSQQDAYNLVSEKFHISMTAVRIASKLAKLKMRKRLVDRMRTESTERPPDLLKIPIHIPKVKPATVQKCDSEALMESSDEKKVMNGSDSPMTGSKCDLCWQQFQNSEILISHSTTDYLHQVIKMEVCPSSKALKEFESGFFCELCDGYFSDTPSSHIFSVGHQDRKVVRPNVCKLCFSRFKSDQDLMDHHLKFHENLLNEEPTDSDLPITEIITPKQESPVGSDYANSESREGDCYSFSAVEVEMSKEQEAEKSGSLWNKESVDGCFCAHVDFNDVAELLALREKLDIRIAELMDDPNCFT